MKNLRFIISLYRRSSNTINIYSEYYNENPAKLREACRAIIAKDNKIFISYETKTDQLMMLCGGF